jgi:hypothetical protein
MSFLVKSTTRDKKIKYGVEHNLTYKIYLRGRFSHFYVKEQSKSLPKSVHTRETVENNKYTMSVY